MIEEIRNGFETAYIDGTVVSGSEYRPQFISNNYKEGKKVLSALEQELRCCDCFRISVAFITSSGIAPLLLTLQELEKKGIPGEILTTDYLNFSEPKALEKLNSLSNIKLKMYNMEKAGEGFHTKGYIFKKEEIYRIIIGSSNITLHALTLNKEWNTKLISTGQGEMAREIVEEFNDLWNSTYAIPYEECREAYKERFEIIRHQREMAAAETVPSIDKYRLQPNSMQVGFITNLRKIVASGESRALLISATGTGKTYASAFAMREMGYKKVLFLVHRGQLARQTKKSYERVFAKTVSMGLVGSGYHDYNADYVFATVQTLNRDEHLLKYDPEEFDCIVLDEAHHVPADTYQKIMRHFRPKLWLGMTATPDKRDDNEEGRNVYELFHYQIAYEIRLGQAMEEDLLCPFHYFGISDLKMIGDEKTKLKNLTEQDFIRLTGDERVRHIIEQAQYFGYSGERVKGLIFCSRIEESEMLSKRFNQVINPETGKYYRTIALNGSASEEERQSAFERLATDDEVTEDGKNPLDYIFSVEILNEGVDIVEVNQVIMLRPTQSPIVFIQQLGRGLRKAEGKEYVVILDFIGNYNNNFMIPIALSGDRTYNADTIRKYVISGNNTIPGASTVHFDEVSREKIFASINRIRGMKTIIKDSYVSLKNRLGRIPYLLDFYENGEVDPLVIIKEFKTYQNFLETVEKEIYSGKISDEEMIKLEYLSKTILSGTRPYELLILKSLLEREHVDECFIADRIKSLYGYEMNPESFNNALGVLKGQFVSKEEELEKYGHIDIIDPDSSGEIHRLNCLKNAFEHAEFYRQLKDIAEVGLRRYEDKYALATDIDSPFVLYEKYSRRDVSLLMNCGKDLSSTMYGMKRIGDDAFIFVTYHKTESDDEKEYVEGKPDYADAFEDNVTFKWDSQMGRGIESGYVADVKTAKRKHLLVKKSDAETNFYYVGQFDILNIKAAKKKDNAGKLRDITKFEMRMKHPVREDLLQYLQSNIKTAEEA